MTYGVSTFSSGPVPLLMMVVDRGFGSFTPAGNPGIFSYQSSHGSTEILATGFFTGVGFGSRGSGNQGIQLGDIIINRASTNPNTGIAGRVTMHSVIASSANVASTLASSGYGASYDCTVASAT